MYAIQRIYTKKAYFYSKFHKTKTLDKLSRTDDIFKKYSNIFYVTYKRHKFIYEMFYCVFKYKTLSYLIV